MYQTYYAPFQVRCPLSGKNETLYVPFSLYEGKWYRIPPNICDNGHAGKACEDCVMSVLLRAQDYTPPFPK